MDRLLLARYELGLKITPDGFKVRQLRQSGFQMYLYFEEIFMHPRLTRIKPWLIAGTSVICLMAGDAHATSVSGVQEVWTNGAWTYNAYGDFNLSSPGASPVSYGAPSVTETNIQSWAAANVGGANMYASVTPLTQTWRASSAASSNGGTENKASVLGSSTRTQTVYVAAGTSGLNLGSQVTLQFTLRVDGTMALGNTAYPPGTFIGLSIPYGYAASATETMSYQVYNLSVDNEVAALEFQHRADATYGYGKDQYSDVLTDTFSSNGYYSNDGNHNWTNLLSNVTIDDTVSPVPLIVSPNTSTGLVRPVDTGYVTISLDAHIGDHLLIEGQLYTEAHAWGDLRMYALSDFSSTFDTEVISLTAGVELQGLQAGVAAVPEPETYALMLAGLGLVGWMARRRKLAKA
jgi:hypothetical protein